jgi:Glucose-6-phosphate dehydrogenase, C-terminal domain
MVTMEPPVGFDAGAIRSKKAELLAAIPEVKPSEAVRGQYGGGTVLGKKTKAYRRTERVREMFSLKSIQMVQGVSEQFQSISFAGAPFSHPRCARYQDHQSRFMSKRHKKTYHRSQRGARRAPLRSAPPRAPAPTDRAGRAATHGALSGSLPMAQQQRFR